MLFCPFEAFQEVTFVPNSPNTIRVKSVLCIHYDGAGFSPGGWLIGEKGQSEISLKIVSGVIDLE